MQRFLTTNPSVQMISDNFDNGTYTCDILFQRGLVWDRKIKSKLINTILNGFAILPLGANLINGKYYIFDGQQRAEAVHSFLANEYKLIGLEPVIINGVEYIVNGKKFNDLPQELKNVIRSYVMTLWYGENLTDDEMQQQYINWNSGIPLTKFEMTKAYILSTREFVDLSNHKIFSEIMSEKMIQKSKNFSLVLQVYAILFFGEKSLLDTKIRKELMSKRITKAEYNIMEQCFDYYFNLIDCLSKISTKESIKAYKQISDKKTNFVTIIALINQVKSLSEDIFAEWVLYFFNPKDIMQTTISNDYNLTLAKNTSSAANVTKRYNVALDSLKKFVNQANKKEKAVNK